MGFIAAGEDREHWINESAIKTASAIAWSTDGGQPLLALRLDYLDGDHEEWFAMEARELWIALGLHEVVSDGDGNAKMLKTPFGERKVI